MAARVKLDVMNRVLVGLLIAAISPSEGIASGGYSSPWTDLEFETDAGERLIANSSEGVLDRLEVCLEEENCVVFCEEALRGISFPVLSELRLVHSSGLNSEGALATSSVVRLPFDVENAQTGEFRERLAWLSVGNPVTRTIWADASQTKLLSQTSVNCE